MNTTGHIIANLRDSKSLSQKELGKFLGVSASTVGHWETGKRSLTELQIKKIADFFNVTTDYLLGRTTLTEKEKIDIGLEVEKLLNGLSNKADINFYGEPLTEQGKQNLKIAIQMAMEMNKVKAKEKFTPKKYKK